MIGSGGMARTYLDAFCQVRTIKKGQATEDERGECRYRNCYCLKLSGVTSDARVVSPESQRGRHVSHYHYRLCRRFSFWHISCFGCTIQRNEYRYRSWRERV